jgi:hypothetical protein
VSTSNGTSSSRVRVFALATIVGSAALLRLVPHPPNLTPVGGMALFAGAHFASLGLAIGVPLLAMVVSDLALKLFGLHGIHSGMPVVYACFVAAALLGRLLRERRRPLALFGMALASATLFSLATNLWVWARGSLYPKSAASLEACFIAALPFFRNTLAGDLLTTGVLFGAFALAERRWPTLRPSNAGDAPP